MLLCTLRPNEYASTSHRPCLHLLQGDARIDPLSLMCMAVGKLDSAQARTEQETCQWRCPRRTLCMKACLLLLWCSLRFRRLVLFNNHVASGFE